MVIKIKVTNIKPIIDFYKEEVKKTKKWLEEKKPLVEIRHVQLSNWCLHYCKHCALACTKDGETLKVEILEEALKRDLIKRGYKLWLTGGEVLDSINSDHINFFSKNKIPIKICTTNGFAKTKNKKEKEEILKKIGYGLGLISLHTFSNIESKIEIAKYVLTENFEPIIFTYALEEGKEKEGAEAFFKIVLKILEDEKAKNFANKFFGVNSKYYEGRKNFGLKFIDFSEGYDKFIGKYTIFDFVLKRGRGKYLNGINMTIDPFIDIVDIGMILLADGTLTSSYWYSYLIYTEGIANIYESKKEIEKKLKELSKYLFLKNVPQTKEEFEEKVIESIRYKIKLIEAHIKWLEFCNDRTTEIPNLIKEIKKLYKDWEGEKIIENERNYYKNLNDISIIFK